MQLPVIPPESVGAFHLPRYFRNFGRMSNGQVQFGSVRPEYLAVPLVVIHFDRSDRNLPFHLTNWRLAVLLQFSSFSQMRGTG